jgi:hypothetical protein
MALGMVRPSASFAGVRIAAKCQAASHARPANDASFAKSPQGNDAKRGAACDTIAVNQDYVFTSMPRGPATAIDLVCEFSET